MLPDPDGTWGSLFVSPFFLLPTLNPEWPHFLPCLLQLPGVRWSPLYRLKYPKQSTLLSGRGTQLSQGFPHLGDGEGPTSQLPVEEASSYWTYGQSTCYLTTGPPTSFGWHPNLQMRNAPSWLHSRTKSRSGISRMKTFSSTSMVRKTHFLCGAYLLAEFQYGAQFPLPHFFCQTCNPSLTFYSEGNHEFASLSTPFSPRIP